tara:strand:+ start:2055 stop:3812 length:1758 start_codon:yes stop_codon:yes gene_type:complete
MINSLDYQKNYYIKFPLRIYRKLNNKYKLSLLLLFFLMIFCSLLESFTLYSIIPVIKILTDNEITYQDNLFSKLISFLNITKESSSILFITFIFLIILTTVFRLVTIYLTTNLSARIGTYISTNVFSKIMHDPFQEHIKRSSSDVINTLVRKSHLVVLSINSILQIIISFVLVGFVSTTLFLINSKLTLLITSSFALIYLFIGSTLNKKLVNNGRLASSANQKQIKAAQDGLGSARNVILNNSYNYFIKQYFLKDSLMRKREGENLFFNMAPRYLVEGISLTLIFLIIIILKSSIDVKEFIPILGAFALGSQRLIPMFQQFYSGFAAISAHKVDVQSMLDYLYKDSPISEKKIKALNFKNSIELQNISFKYDGAEKETLKKISLSISKGDRIGLIGKTGSGKTTLVDVISGLLKPTDGKIFVDNQIQSSRNLKNFQQIISYIPQNTFLVEGTIIDNVAFGVDRDKVDLKKIKRALKCASIYEYVNSLPKKFETYVGERGITLSGGQAQRISIARAFYRNSSILILDESTSALDMSTELEITNALKNISSDITIIIIAHRPSTLKICNKIIKMDCGGIENIEKVLD